MATFAARKAGLDPSTPDDLATDRQHDPLLTPLGPTADRAARWRRIREMRAQIAAQREQRKQQEQALADARRVCEETGPHGYLTATVQLGVVLSIAGDERRLQYADTEDLRHDALAILSGERPSVRLPESLALDNDHYEGRIADATDGPGQDAR